MIGETINNVNEGINHNNAIVGAKQLFDSYWHFLWLVRQVKLKCVKSLPKVTITTHHTWIWTQIGWCLCQYVQKDKFIKCLILFSKSSKWNRLGSSHPYLQHLEVCDKKIDMNLRSVWALKRVSGKPRLRTDLTSKSIKKNQWKASVGAWEMVHNYWHHAALPEDLSLIPCICIVV